jgi:hypothetical protein
MGPMVPEGWRGGRSGLTLVQTGLRGTLVQAPSKWERMLYYRCASFSRGANQLHCKQVIFPIRAPPKNGVS